ncbi:MAG: c-type cytochrome [Gammaproteobacteria bacterium]|nr:c-type cytochrome [Gammaproteobacteria bacterium]
MKKSEAGKETLCRRLNPGLSGRIAVTVLAVASVAFLPAVTVAQGVAGDAAAGKAKAAVCAACHGPAGVSVNPAWPSLAGQQPVYLAKQIRLFRDGVRVEPTMQPFVQNLSDEDIDDIAAYYAELSPCP